jgi:hypothetical protein
MSKNNIKHENVFTVFVIAAILAMAAISATAILPNDYYMHKKMLKNLPRSYLEKQRYHLLRQKLLEMQLLSSIRQATR